jgi:hypothetical protein
MPSSLTVLSWNIENIGSSKINDKTVKKRQKPPYLNQEPGECYIVNFISAAIKYVNADIIGVMEARSGEADNVIRLIKGALPQDWDGIASSKQNAMRQEQSFFMWKLNQNNVIYGRDDKPFSIQLDKTQLPYYGLPSPASLIGIIDDNSLRDFFSANGFTTTNQKQVIYDALLECKYIKKPTYPGRRGRRLKTDENSYIMVPEQWNILANKKGVVDFSSLKNPPALSQDQLVSLTNVLIATDIIQFPTANDRPPFLLNLSLTNTDYDEVTLLLSILHAPGPQEEKRFSAFYNQRLSSAFQKATNLLVMGDFNINGPDRENASFLEYDRLKNEEGDITFGPVSSSKVFKDPFSALLSPPIFAEDLLGDDVKTSIKDPSSEVTFENYKSEAYDKFFFKSTSPFQPLTHDNTAGCVDMALAMYPDAPEKDLYSEELAKLGVRYYKTRATEDEITKVLNNIRQKKKRKAASQAKNKKNVKKRLVSQRSTIGPGSVNSKRNEADTILIDTGDAELLMIDDTINTVSDAVAMLKPATVQIPPNFNTFLTVYGAISDHMPICVMLTLNDDND